MSLQIAPEHAEIVRTVLQKNVPNHEVWAFGSRAKGAAKPYSDLDLAVIGNEPLPLATLADLANDFSDSDLPWTVDIVDWAATSPEFREIIAGQKIVFQTACLKKA